MSKAFAVAATEADPADALLLRVGPTRVGVVASSTATAASLMKDAPPLPTRGGQSEPNTGEPTANKENEQ